MIMQNTVLAIVTPEPDHPRICPHFGRDGSTVVLSRDSQTQFILLGAEVSALVPDLFCYPHDVFAENTADFLFAVTLFEHEVG